jgi:CelD/BcsL family acetyltransferase involved in cellulose biosynthesis
MRLIVSDKIPENEELQRAWNDLVLRMESPEVFYTYEWALALSRSYSASVRPLLVLGYDGSTLAGVASLAMDEQHRTLSFLAGNTADYCDFVSAPDRRFEFVGQVMRELQDLAPHLVLPNLPAASSTGWALKDFSARQGSSHFSRLAFRCGRVDLTVRANRNQIKHATGAKKAIRQGMNAMARTGTVEIRHLDDWSEISEALPAFRNAHLQRFYSMGRVSNLAGAERWNFLLELARLLSKQKRCMTFSQLMLDGEPISWAYGFRFHGSWFYYQPAFQSRFSQYNPGLCLLGQILQDACDDPSIQRVELGLGDEEYKHRFANAYCETSYVTVTTSLARHVRGRLRYQAATAIKSMPALEHCVRWLLARTVMGSARA